MIETSEEESSTVTSELKALVRDAIAYFGSTLNLVQARFVELALSSAVFMAMIAVSFLLVIASLVVLNVALGIWLTHLTGHVGWSLLILGVFYIVLAAIISWSGLRWLKKLRS